ncbi:MAG: hypothetical protein M1544_00100 [Candidatus Marsarchaeota archaeon]|nr:hypothetical protein [Candidatus Marsarchaeota archaeon]
MKMSFNLSDGYGLAADMAKANEALDKAQKALDGIKPWYRRHIGIGLEDNSLSISIKENMLTKPPKSEPQVV